MISFRSGRNASYMIKRSSGRYMVSLEVGEDLAGAIEELAKMNEISQGALIRLLLKKALKELEAGEKGSLIGV